MASRDRKISTSSGNGYFCPMDEKCISYPSDKNIPFYRCLRTRFKKGHIRSMLSLVKIALIANRALFL